MFTKIKYLFKKLFNLNPVTIYITQRYLCTISDSLYIKLGKTIANLEEEGDIIDLEVNNPKARIEITFKNEWALSRYVEWMKEDKYD